MTIICKVDLGILKHKVFVVGEEGNILEQQEVYFKDVSEAAIDMGRRYAAEAIMVTGLPHLKDEIVSEISQMDTRFTII